MAEKGKNIQPQKNDIADNTVTSCCYNCSFFEVRNWAASWFCGVTYGLWFISLLDPKEHWKMFCHCPMPINYYKEWQKSSNDML